MDVRIQVHVEINTPIVAQRDMSWLTIGDELVIFFAAGSQARPEAVAAITDRMIEQLMVIREAALKQAVREGDRQVVDELERSTLRSEPPMLGRIHLVPTPYEVARRAVDETGEPPDHDRKAHHALAVDRPHDTRFPDTCPRCAWNVAQAERVDAGRGIDGSL